MTSVGNGGNTVLLERLTKLRKTTMEQFESDHSSATTWSILYGVGVVMSIVAAMWGTESIEGAAVFGIAVTMILATVLVVGLWLKVYQAKARVELLSYIVKELVT